MNGREIKNNDRKQAIRNEGPERDEKRKSKMVCIPRSRIQFPATLCFDGYTHGPVLPRAIMPDARNPQREGEREVSPLTFDQHKSNTVPGWGASALPCDWPRAPTSYIRTCIQSIPPPASHKKKRAKNRCVSAISGKGQSLARRERRNSHQVPSFQLPDDPQRGKTRL